MSWDWEVSCLGSCCPTCEMLYVQRLPHQLLCNRSTASSHKRLFWCSPNPPTLRSELLILSGHAALRATTGTGKRLQKPIVLWLLPLEELLSVAPGEKYSTSKTKTPNKHKSFHSQSCTCSTDRTHTVPKQPGVADGSSVTWFRRVRPAQVC